MIQPVPCASFIAAGVAALLLRQCGSAPHGSSRCFSSIAQSSCFFHLRQVLVLRPRLLLRSHITSASKPLLIMRQIYPCHILFHVIHQGVPVRMHAITLLYAPWTTLCLQQFRAIFLISAKSAVPTVLDTPVAQTTIAR